MEKLFYAAKLGDETPGTFGTLYECCEWILRSEGVDDRPDSEDPLESINEILGFAPETKYELEPAENVLPKLLKIEEAMRLKALPQDIRVSDIPDWIVSGSHDNSTLSAMAQLLHGRTTKVRYRGEFHHVGSSPFTPGQYDALLAQLSS